MKYFFSRSLLIVGLIILPLSPGVAHSKECPESDKINVVELKAGTTYSFNTTFINRKYRTQIQHFEVEFTEQGDINGGENPNFRWTEEVKKLPDFVLEKGVEIQLVESENYPIVYLPVKKSNDNIVVKYTTKYREKHGNKIMGPFFDVRCQYYSISP